jgi:hypothetical protein
VGEEGGEMGGRDRETERRETEFAFFACLLPFCFSKKRKKYQVAIAAVVTSAGCSFALLFQPQGPSFAEFSRMYES